MIPDSQVHRIVSDTITKQMGCTTEHIVVLYDRDSPLSCRISDAYIAVLHKRPNTVIQQYDETKKQETIDLLLGLETGSSVFLVQSSSFRLDDFRIRLQLFNNGVGCLEHSHLSYYPPEQEETFIQSLEWNGDEYARLGETIGKLLETSDEIQIYSGKNEVLHFGPMEECKINDGRFYSQKNRGGSSICGEVFSESKDLESVSGTLSICCYPNEHFLIQQCEPFTITLEKGRITKVDENAPQEFMENIINRVKSGEYNENGDGEVMIREAGFGLNPFISFQNPLSYVSVFERQAGFHVSVGKKHNIYRKKFPKDVIQRYHIDIFSNCTKMVAVQNKTETVFFENGKYCV